RPWNSRWATTWRCTRASPPTTKVSPCPTQNAPMWIMRCASGDGNVMPSMLPEDKRMALNYCEERKRSVGWRKLVFGVFFEALSIFLLYAGRIHGVDVCKSDVVVIYAPQTLAWCFYSLLLCRRINSWIAVAVGGLLSVAGFIVGMCLAAVFYGT